MSNVQFAILVLILLFGFGMLDNSGCGCVIFIIAALGLAGIAGVALL